MKNNKLTKFTVFILLSLLLCLLVTGCQSTETESEISSTISVPSEIVGDPEDEIIESVSNLDTFEEDTYYLGVDLSGLTYKEALELVKAKRTEFEKKLNSFTLTVMATGDEDNEVSFTIKGSDSGFFDKTETKLAELMVHDINGNHKMEASFDKNAILSKLEEAFKGFNIEPKDAVITGVSDGKVTYEKAVMGKKVNASETLKLIEESFVNLEATEIEAVLEEVEPELTDEYMINGKKVRITGDMIKE